MSVKNFRAYDTTTVWSGPPRATMAEAEADATAHNKGCASQGGYGSAIACRRDPEAPSRLEAYDGEGAWYSVWPPHGRSNGAARWVEVAPSVATWLEAAQYDDTSAEEQRVLAAAARLIRERWQR